MQFVDKTTLNQGAVLGIKTDCNLSVSEGCGCCRGRLLTSHQDRPRNSTSSLRCCEFGHHATSTAPLTHASHSYIAYLGFEFPRE
jgi:hypothetical protein